MMKTYLYLTEELDREIKETAREQNKTKAEVMRQALEKGIGKVKYDPTASARIMLKLAKIGKKYNLRGPKDLSKNLDKYLWEEYEP